MSETLLGAPDVPTEQPTNQELAIGSEKNEQTISESIDHAKTQGESRGWEYDMAVGEGHDTEGVTKEEFEKMSPDEQARVLGNFRG